ncbi:uncharacterized protein EAF02_000551 [Botrytis sinoallii]|uniref:Uncharacterized protein n=1 Tax=Botrytis deweyae TaxID=2478750 RepID=A0ABQ7IM20_9HELO|nr:uncharacterized protein EAF02_000551 [Botrytis sinoallii]XP_038810255.1 uncharacterized protein EAE98_005532 [Botrytis deweyae]KAF7893013.1 hypothetical protein EAF02_000551 [Botrytis sinoallii]KAF7928476.1 hypothetical protein EAE98_005532 [Botrytis deweyae]
MYFQRFVIAAIVLPLAIAAPIANTAAENKNSQVIQKDDKYDGVASSSATLHARQILWTILGPLGFEPVVDGINGALVGLGLK